MNDFFGLDKNKYSSKIGFSEERLYCLGNIIIKENISNILENAE